MDWLYWSYIVKYWNYIVNCWNYIKNNWNYIKNNWNELDYRSKRCIYFILNLMNIIKVVFRVFLFG